MLFTTLPPVASVRPPGRQLVTLIILFLATTINPLQAKIWTVSPSGSYTTPASVANLVNDGDTIHIEAALYSNHPQVKFSKNDLFITGINGRPRLEAGSALANNTNGKAIFVLSGSNCKVENIEFANAKVPDNNGAGIRQEGCDLLVKHCYFNNNEMGILGGNYSPCKVVIEHCIFANNGSPANPGFQHNIYINHIDTLIFRYNYTVDAIAQGHELKSRAHVNVIMYNYIGNVNTVDSRNIDLPNGGTAIIMGNVIEQGQSSANSNIAGFGMEGLTNNAPHNVWFVNNSVINKKTTGSFIQVKDGIDTLFVKNNIMVGAKTGGLFIGVPKTLDSSNNLISNSLSLPAFVDLSKSHFQLLSTSPCIDAGKMIPQKVGAYPLNPLFQYADSADFTMRPIVGNIDLGALEYSGSVGVTKLKTDKISVYPNPCNGDWLHFDNPDPNSFSIYSLTGGYIYGGIFIGGRANISTCPPGIYVLRMSGQTFHLIRN